VLRDYSVANVQAGQALVAQRQIAGVSFEQADAFDPRSYERITPHPNIAVVSGLLELFPDNTPVRQCLGGIANVIEDGGYLIYTGQPWHPQIEMTRASADESRRRALDNATPNATRTGFAC
jgi:hypothetical protein